MLRLEIHQWAITSTVLAPLQKLTSALASPATLCFDLCGAVCFGVHATLIFLKEIRQQRVFWLAQQIIKANCTGYIGYAFTC